jgi:hypothetical protein
MMRQLFGKAARLQYDNPATIRQLPIRKLYGIFAGLPHFAAIYLKFQ